MVIITVFFKRKKELAEVKRKVVLTEHITDSIITYAKSCHPNEGILILQGKKDKHVINVTGLIIPPFQLMGHIIRVFLSMSFHSIYHILERFIRILADQTSHP